MKSILTDAQRAVIAACQLNSKSPLKTLARQLGVQERSVRHNLGTLLQRKILHEAPFINVYPLGYRYVNLYFSVGSSKPATVDLFIKALIDLPSVSWLAELGGDFHFGVSFMVREVEEVRTALDTISKRFPDIFFEKSYVFHLGLTVFPPKYLNPGASKVYPLGYGSTGKRAEVDELDMKILSLMTEKHICSGRALARELGKAHATVEVRLRNLEKEKVIAGYWYMFDAGQLGYQTLKLLIYAKGHPHDLSAKLFEFARKHPNISYFIECLGSWDFELGLEMEHPSQAAEVTRAIFDSLGPSINTIKVVPMFRVLKWKQYFGDTASQKLATK